MDNNEKDEKEKEKAIKCLRSLRDLLTDDLDLKSPIHDERFLIRFVRAKKYDPVLAHQCVRKYFRARRKFRHLYNNAFPSYEPVKACLELNGVAKLKYDDPEGRNIIVCNSRYWDVTKFGFDDYVISVTLIMEELSEVAQTKGIVVLSDKEGFTSEHAKTYSLSTIKGFLSVLQGAMPIRLKGLYFLNEKKMMEVILAIARPFFSEKFKSRFHVYGPEFGEVVKLIGPERLPKTLGGDLTDDEAYDYKFRNRLFQRDSYYRGFSEYGFGEGCSDDEDTYM